jgi:hypothetical protein
MIISYHFKIKSAFDNYISLSMQYVFLCSIKVLYCLCTILYRVEGTCRSHVNATSAVNVNMAGVPDYYERKGALFLRSDHMNYGRATLNSNWYSFLTLSLCN